MDTFAKWAAYRTPQALEKFASNPNIKYMIGSDQAATAAVGALGLAAATGTGIGIGVGVSQFVADSADSALSASEFGEAAASDLSFGATAAAAGPRS